MKSLSAILRPVHRPVRLLVAVILSLPVILIALPVRADTASLAEQGDTALIRALSGEAENVEAAFSQAESFYQRALMEFQMQRRGAGFDMSYSERDTLGRLQASLGQVAYHWANVRAENGDWRNALTKLEDAELHLDQAVLSLSAIRTGEELALAHKLLGGVYLLEARLGPEQSRHAALTEAAGSLRTSISVLPPEPGTHPDYETYYNLALTLRQLEAETPEDQRPALRDEEIAALSIATQGFFPVDRPEIAIPISLRLTELLYDRSRTQENGLRKDDLSKAQSVVSSLLSDIDTSTHPHAFVTASYWYGQVTQEIANFTTDPTEADAHRLNAKAQLEKAQAMVAADDPNFGLIANQIAALEAQTQGK